MSPVQRPSQRKNADPDVLKDLMYGRGPAKRFTQDSPVMPDVWLAYGECPTERIDLLLTPHIRPLPTPSTAPAASPIRT